MVKKEVILTGTFHVTVDETKFTPEFMAEFREHFFNFETIDDHIAHLAQMFGRGVVDGSDTFIEGYGPPADFGIKFETYRGASSWDMVPVAVELREPEMV